MNIPIPHLRPRDDIRVHMEQELAEKSAQIAELKALPCCGDHRLLASRLLALQEAAERQQGALIVAQETIRERDARIAALLVSRSWRVTAPLRWLGQKAGRLRQNMS